jgi:Zn-dependent protease
VAAAAFGKYGLVLLKLGKLGPTLISMVLTVGIMAARFGWAYGVGLVALIAVHESGHLLFARYEGVKVGAPIFLGPFGAVIGLKQPPKDARQEAVIAIGGPVVGTAGAILALLWSQAAPAGSSAHDLLLALAYVGFLINLFNLIPFSPLDGGRVASALSPWANVVGVGVILLLILGPAAAGRPVNPLLLAILVIGGISTWQRFKRRGLRPEYENIPGTTRLWIGLAYAAMLAITALGMAETHAALAAITSQ